MNHHHHWWFDWRLTWIWWESSLIHASDHELFLGPVGLFGGVGLKEEGSWNATPPSRQECDKGWKHEITTTPPNITSSKNKARVKLIDWPSQNQTNFRWARGRRVLNSILNFACDWLGTDRSINQEGTNKNTQWFSLFIVPLKAPLKEEEASKSLVFHSIWKEWIIIKINGVSCARPSQCPQRRSEQPQWEQLHWESEYIVCLYKRHWRIDILQTCESENLTRQERNSASLWSLLLPVPVYVPR